MASAWDDRGRGETRRGHTVAAPRGAGCAVQGSAWGAAASATTRRQIVKKLVTGPIKFTPKRDKQGRGYFEFEAEGSLAKLLTNGVPILVSSPTGFETWGKSDFPGNSRRDQLCQRSG